ncbi:PorT family protein [Flavobacterium sp. MFBS3-15]|uniref:porin family protein n=1 Tax=Flavobacterium sp. MFBS3-15 TaxID=2989816 RepID=UPI0022360A15|nr:porin family protein [Flavobacterium sp. MFBS3-15]MCW4469734.1 PorT family protein [Flavobacterium sp. MFBS3-15]
MKKLNILLIALLPAMAFAQEETTPKPIKFGVQAGATYSGLRGNPGAEENDYAVDYLLGLSIEVPISERLSFIGNLNYERKSFSREIQIEEDPFDPIFQPVNLDVRATLHYILVPLNLKYYLDPAKKFYVNGGLFAGFFLDNTLKVDGDKVEDESGDGIFKTLDFGLNLGLGMRIPLDNKNDLNIELRDNLGLVNISDVPVMDDGTVKTNSVNLIVSWQFGL